ncbi:glycosyltransferase family 4 protein [Gammaproteobacteria bacterium]|nr:glycosyltransferase family 4 protein [Gammaproteobacteria bacterium]
MKLLIDGRPIRDPLSGSAVFIIELYRAMRDVAAKKLFLQSDRSRNLEIKKMDVSNAVVTNGSRQFENILYELGFNVPSNRGVYDVGLETYFARLPFVCRSKVATVHDVIPLDYPKWFTWRNSSFAKRNFLRQVKECSVIVFSSEFTASRALEHAGHISNYSVIPLAISDALHDAALSYNPVGNLQFGEQKLQGGTYILAVGNIEPRKNLTEIAKAVQRLNSNGNHDLKLVIAGRRNYDSEEIERQLSLELGDKVIYLGFVTDEEKLRLYQNCACHVYASKYEGFGIPPVESLVVGTPTVIADNSSLSELIPATEFGYLQGDVDDLCEKIEWQINKRCDHVANFDFEAYKQKYSWSRVAAEYLSLLEQV